MKSNSTFARRIADASTMFVVALLCVGLLIYIAYGTTKRTFEQLLVEKSIAQAELVRSPMETYLRPGLPLRQFTGFNQLTNSMIEADSTLLSMIVETTDGELVFSAGDAKRRTLPPQAAKSPAPDAVELRRTNNILQVLLPLRNKFERVGNLVITMDRSEIERRLSAEFRLNLLVALMASLAFSLVIFKSSMDSAYTARKPVAIAFTATFIVVATSVIMTMIGLFTAGAESKGRALVDSLGQRFDDIPQYGLQLEQIAGLGEVLESYQKLNPEISSIGITINGRVAVHTDRSKIGSFWSTDPSHAEYRAMMTPANHPRAALVILSVPKNYVVWQVARNVKNYAALFVASALLAFLFLQLAQVLRAAHTAARASGRDWRTGVALDLVKPVFFLAVFLDNLCYAFLPQFVSEVARNEGAAAGAVAWPFTAYYLCFALALVPAGRYGREVGTRNLVVGALALITAGLLAMTQADSLGQLVLARAVTGIGQGALFIGVQSYILTNSQRANRTSANGIIVYGFQGGMISGMAIGSLLVGEIGPLGVFYAAAFVAVAVIVYTVALLPAETTPSATETAAQAEPAMTSKVFWSEIGQLLRDQQFMQIILLIGIPAKAVLTGVILFALPLLLTSMGFAQEDIGQITMIYAGCVIVSSMVAGHLADRLQECRRLLVWGALLTAIGLVTIAAAGTPLVVTGPKAVLIQTCLIILGAAVIGWAHGLINAPVVTHIADTAVAARIGAGPTAAAYRLLERGGHTLGPVLMGQLFLIFGTSPLVLAWLGAAIAVCAVTFHLINPSGNTQPRNEEFA